jgi:hypothetical protein
MALKINVPDNAWSEQSISLSGIDYRFVFYFNDRDSRWRLDIFSSETPVITGIKIMENQALVTANYYPDLFQHGELFCIRVKQDGLPVGRSNLGFNKAYEIMYLTVEEVNEIGG